ncbi:hypothetical protein [Nonomuraea polychroma]|uniref:hypothetical protein n=1 Tax=Nonomuraea polychroma TaxID=46176 RepID=UPI000FDE654A|nr:hypothetical protein [Nonomuraea polychroma]
MFRREVSLTATDAARPYDLAELDRPRGPGRPSAVRRLMEETKALTADDVTFQARLRLDTPREADYYRHGGIMPYVLRGLLAV